MAKSRSEIPATDKWNLDKLYTSDEQWEKDLKTLESYGEKISALKGNFAPDLPTLKKNLEFMTQIDLLDERLGYYAHLRQTEDLSNDSSNDRFARYVRVATIIGSASSYITPEIQLIPQDKVEEYLTAPALKDYWVFLKKITRYKPHVLSDAEEKLLALQSEANQTPQKAFAQLTNVDLSFGSVKTEEGEKELTQSTYSLFMENKDNAVREEAFHKFYDTFEGHQNVLTSLLEGSYQQDIYKAKVRNYPSALEMSLFRDDVPTSVYDTLIERVHHHLPLLHSYYELRGKLLGKEKMDHWDAYVSLVDDVELKHSYNEAVSVIKEAVAPLGTEYQQTLEEGLLGGWVDKYENKGKRSGAFSAGSYVGDPYILINYQDEVIRSLFTLAHEAGHSMHSWYSVRNNPFPQYNYTIFEAEVASTVNEQLLAAHLLKTHNDPQIRTYIIGKQIDDFIATIFRQTMFAEFEYKAHKMMEEGKPLTPQSLRKTYRKLLEQYFGPKVNLDEKSDLEALRIPHFYNAFYVYKYATGLSSAITISQNILTEGESATSKYLNFLKSGGSEFPLDSLLKAGVDLRTPGVIDKAMTQFDSLLKEFKELLS
ncbi:oligoendopeptidase F [Spirochaeta cellobiosiphila]|uniref:oligoendopeptidase F n=1 Tax=Spirochaeta cellobiosiphila TaxID=504483 RepID=UPI000417A130|nr:oligoendopeptidase F [Spirochaeta cellobiosiphila]